MFKSRKQFDLGVLFRNLKEVNRLMYDEIRGSDTVQDDHELSRQVEYISVLTKQLESTICSRHVDFELSWKDYV